MAKRFYEERQFDEIVTIGIYGDEVGKDYNYSVRNFIDACRRNKVKVSNYVDYGDGFGWEMDLTGRALTIYKLVNFKINGYNARSFDEFIDQYEIWED